MLAHDNLKKMLNQHHLNFVDVLEQSYVMSDICLVIKLLYCMINLQKKSLNNVGAL